MRTEALLKTKDMLPGTFLKNKDTLPGTMPPFNIKSMLPGTMPLLNAKNMLLATTTPLLNTKSTLLETALLPKIENTLLETTLLVLDLLTKGTLRKFQCLNHIEGIHRQIHDPMPTALRICKMKMTQV